VLRGEEHQLVCRFLPGLITRDLLGGNTWVEFGESLISIMLLLLDVDFFSLLTFDVYIDFARSFIFLDHEVNKTCLVYGRILSFPS
jgi:hypothetical protein